MSPKQLMEKKAKRLSIYIGESDKWRGKALYAALLETMKSQGLAGATVTRGLAGFGAHSIIHTASIEVLSMDLPLVIQAIDSPEKIDAALEVITPMVGEGLMTIDDVDVIKYTHRYLNPLPADKLVDEVMTRDVVSLSPEMSVVDAWQKMLDTLLKALPVVDRDGAVVGMLTDEDLLERAGLQQRISVAGRLDAEHLNDEVERLRKSPLKVADVMSKPAITVRTSDHLGMAAARMAKKAIKRLPVVNEKGKLVGVLSRVDILRLVTDKLAQKVTAPLGAATSVKDVMSLTIPVVKRDDDLATIVDKMLEGGYHRLIVIGAEGKAVGLISDSDVVARIQPAQRRGVLAALAGSGKTPPSDATAEELMSPGVLTAKPETPLIEAAKMMMKEQRKWLVVVDGLERPLGLVDRHILLRAMTSG